MKITFSWKNVDDRKVPVCTSDTFNKDNISIISCLLMDDGGIPYLEMLPWIDEGILRLNNIFLEKTSFNYWDREDWGTYISREKIKIYSLYDENYCEYFSFEDFKIILISWRNFLNFFISLDDKKIIRL